ncbi:RNA-directed DNA polymerase, eukaryota, reverse transcriptase zinc-binding domain protein [Tanacetum coccineum]
MLAMEGLHSLTYKANELGLFTGASIGRDNMRVSHLMYADDVMFFGAIPLVFGMTLGVDSSIQSNWCSVFRRSSRGGAEMNQFEELKAAIGDVILSDQSDSWVWSLDVNTGFSVMSARILVDDSFLEADKRGIEVDSLLCPTCYLDVETINHIFFNCEMAKYLWALLAKWVGS